VVEALEGPLEVEALCVDGVGVEVVLFSVVPLGVVGKDGVVVCVVGPRLEVLNAVVGVAEVVMPGLCEPVANMKYAPAPAAARTTTTATARRECVIPFR